MAAVLLDHALRGPKATRVSRVGEGSGGMSRGVAQSRHVGVEGLKRSVCSSKGR